MTYHETAIALGDAAPLPIKDAAAKMGISVSALRSRLKRGTVSGCKDENGKQLVFLPEDMAEEQPASAPIQEIEAEPQTAEAPAPAIDMETPIARLIDAIQELHDSMGGHDAAIDRLMDLHRDQFESNSNVESRLQEMGHQMEALHTAVKTMGAAFRVHAQETDRLIKALNRSNGAAPAAPSFAPPAHKQRFFGRRQADQEETPPTDDEVSS